MDVSMSKMRLDTCNRKSLNLGQTEYTSTSSYIYSYIQFLLVKKYNNKTKYINQQENVMKLYTQTRNKIKRILEINIIYIIALT